MRRVALLALFVALSACGDEAPAPGGGGAAEPTAGGTSAARADAQAHAPSDPTVPGGAGAPVADDGWRELVVTPNRDLSLLRLMLRLEPVHVGMAPFLRHQPSFEQLALAADAIAALCDEPPFATYTQAASFQRDPQRFEFLRDQLRENARAAAAAARAGDVDGLWSAYVAMDATCVGCHKRYGPLH